MHLNLLKCVINQTHKKYSHFVCEYFRVSLKEENI
jgi:hypothetical protein